MTLGWTLCTRRTRCGPVSVSNKSRMCGSTLSRAMASRLERDGGREGYCVRVRVLRDSVLILDVAACKR